MKVLSVASEMFPIVKTGGLADVVGSLPGAMAPLGVETRTVLPGYPSVLKRCKRAKQIAELNQVIGETVTLLEAKVDGLAILIVRHPSLFERDSGPYTDQHGTDYADNWRRFAVFSKAVAMIATGAIPGYRPDIVHCHDWQAAMVLTYLRYGDTPAPPGVLTIHNIAFQGQFAAQVFGELDLPASAWSLEGVEYYGGVGFLKAGLQMADAITTVSPTYAKEIRSHEFGMGLEGLIKTRAGAVSGIVNGIDTEIWNPGTDPALAANFDARKLKNRSANREAVCARLGLRTDNGLLIAVITRLTWQKGMDLVAEAVDGIVASGASLAILGSGDRGLEDAFRGAAERHPGRVAIEIGYDEKLAHLMQGGCDAILIPSRFEPCGLTQLCGLHYGCVPIVGHTGGLADTVIDGNLAAMAAGVATGFHIAPLSAGTIVEAVELAGAAHADKAAWKKLVKNGMATDVSWNASASRYLDLYRSLVAGNGAASGT
ncbi:MAG: glycogen synthase GlgA [Nitratireductor sp.]|nr:glycogen synthase GlgA [Nitratireductor sp.]